MTSWLNPYRWLLVGGLIAALVAGYFAWSSHQQGIGYQKAQSEYTAQAVKTDLQRASIAVPLAAKQEAAQVQIRTITKTLIEKVPVYVKADACPLPGGFRLLHDAAAANVPVPDASGLIDATPVSAQSVAGTLVDNYSNYHETAARLIGLQEWVKAQQALNSR